MDRRKFISRGSLALIAAAGLPKGILNKPTDIFTYHTKLVADVDDQTYYSMDIDHTCLDGLANATTKEKTISLLVMHYQLYKNKPDKSITLEYLVKESYESELDGYKVWTVKAKLDKKVIGDDELLQKFPNVMMLTGVKLSYFKLFGKKGEIITELSYPQTTTSNTDDCFLTTACVKHKQLADNCDELTTLRFLRENYMRQNTEGIALLNDYKVIGPKLIKAINHFDNSHEIYNYMYGYLVLPSVALIKEKKYADATTYYKDFVKGLRKAYL